MSNETVFSKVLVCDKDEHALSKIKKYFDIKGLIGLSCSSGNVEGLLERNIDLGAVFIALNYFDGHEVCSEFIRKIHKSRPELPIFYRYDSGEEFDLVDLNNKVAGCFSGDFLEELDANINKHIFSSYYPINLIRGIQEISHESLENIIGGCTIECEKVYLVKDNIIYGELFSLIPIESDWGRGFMMLQTEQDSILSAIKNRKTTLEFCEPNFREVNEVLNEITNLIWGKVKSRYIIKEPSDSAIHVPILVNHLEKYISFGSREPQLCFRYIITDNNDKQPPITLYQRLIFNLSYNPCRFTDVTNDVDELVKCGELEFF